MQMDNDKSNDQITQKEDNKSNFLHDKIEITIKKKKNNEETNDYHL